MACCLFGFMGGGGGLGSNSVAPVRSSLSSQPFQKNGAGK